MRLRLACVTLCLLAAVMLAGWGGDGNGPGASATKGAQICADVNKADRLRYNLDYTLSSPKQASPPDDSTGIEWVIKPSQNDFSFEVKYSGAFVQPNRFDFEFSSESGQPATRGIRIGNTIWY